MTVVVLHGALKEIGDRFEFDIRTASEAIAALIANFPKVSDILRVGSWTVMRGSVEDGISMDEDMYSTFSVKDSEVHILPEITGAKNRNGAIKTILGVTLVAMSFGSAAFLAQPISSTLLGGATWGNAIGQVGLSMALSGVSTMLAPEAQAPSSDDSGSYILSGPTSSQGQGVAIPLVYGEVIVGGVLVSGGVDVLPVE